MDWRKYSGFFGILPVVLGWQTGMERKWHINYLEKVCLMIKFSVDLK